jgi:DNA polymerase III alpha subunit
VERVKTNQYGQIEISESEAFNALYTGHLKDINGVFLDNLQVIEQYNQACDTNADRIGRPRLLKDLGISVEEFDQALQRDWFMPKEYQNFELVEFLLDQCHSEEQRNRVMEELELFVQYDMIPVLNYLKYLVDTMRANNIVWGVGRGSSVASYCLYLLGVHKIDSIKFSLDIREFLK